MTSHPPFVPLAHPTAQGGPFAEPAPPNRLRWSPRPMPSAPTDFVDGLYTLAGNGDPAMRLGLAVHLYAANRTMEDRVFYSAVRIVWWPCRSSMSQDRPVAPNCTA